MFALSVLYGLTLVAFWGQAAWHQIVVSLSIAPPLIWLSCVDLRRFEIPDLATGAIATIAVLYGLIAIPSQFPWHVVFAVGLIALLWAIGEIHFRRTGQEGLGIGDAKLFGVGVLLLGPVKLPELMLLASLGGIIAVGLQGLGRSNTSRGIPFGPFIAYAVFVLNFLEPIFL